MSTPDAPPTVFFDGACPLCTRSARALERWLGAGRVTLRDFRRPGALDAYPAISAERAAKKMHVVLRDGRIYAGAEGIARLLAGEGGVGRLAWLYYVPGVRQVADAVYAAVAERRFRVLGGGCDGGTCATRAPRP